jgi:endonuclease YncB( thermonuclease family)
MLRVWLKLEMLYKSSLKYRQGISAEVLGYVYLSDGSMLNEEVVRAGYANLMTVPLNVRYEARFSKAYEEARENRRVLWK